MKYLRHIFLSGSLTLSVSLAIAAVQDDDATFAMADIHGNYAALVALLTQVGLVSDDGQWTGGEATFIQTGDYTDRGPDVRRVMDFLMVLERSAPEGHVVILLGNHEVMNMMGDLRDLTDRDYQSFVDADSEGRRMEALEEYLEFEERRSERLGREDIDDEDPAGKQQAWLAAHPPGFLERRRALSPEGDYGRWLRQRRVVVEHADSLFMHAGIHPGLSSLSVDEINERVQEEIATFDTYVTYLTDEGVILPYFTFTEIVAAVREELDASQDGRIRIDAEHTELLEGFLGIGNWLSVHPQGVLWFRGFAEWTEEEGAPLMDQLLDRYDSERFVVGHTPQAGGQIRSRFGGRLYLADTGMLSSFYPGGQASILEIRNGLLESTYLEATTAPVDRGPATQF